MSREPSFPGEDDRPLARSNFFRSIEAEAAGADGEWRDDDQDGEPAEGWGDDGYADEPAAADDDPAQRRGRRRERGDDVGGSRSGLAVSLLGWALTVAGLGLGALTFQGEGSAVGPILDTVGALGLAPGTLLVAGLMLVVLGSLRGQTERRARHDELRFGRIERALERVGERTPGEPQIERGADSPQLEHALLALERQDEKLANLTRATKMYGKPLIDISKQVAELADQLGDVARTSGAVDALTARLEQIDARLTNLAESSSGGGDEAAAERLAEVTATVRRTAGAIDALRKAVEPRLEQTQERLNEIGDTARRIDQQSRDVESRLIARVDEAWQDGRRRGDELLTAVRQGRDAAVGIGERLDAERRALTESVDALRQSLQSLGSGDAGAEAIGAIEVTLNAVRRELASVATQITRLEARPAIAAPAPAAHAASPQSAGPAPAPAHAPTPAPAPSVGSGAAPAGGLGEGVAHRIAGAHKAGGKNVLGAIAKLRSMKGP